MKEIIDVRGDGNCFYRCLYGYALYNNNLDAKTISEFIYIFDCEESINSKNVSAIRDIPDTKTIRRRLNAFTTKPNLFDEKLNESQEGSFVMCIRKLLSTLAFQHSNVFKDLVDFYKSLDEETFNGLKETYTDWFKEAFNRPPNNTKEFTDVYVKNVLIPGTDACEIDIILIEKYLDVFGYKLNKTILSYASEDAYADCLRRHIPDKPEKNTIYIIKLPGHYNFVRFTDEMSPGSLSKRIIPSGSMLVGGKSKYKNNKIMINYKLYNKYFNPKNKKYYIKKNNKKIHI